MNPLFKQLAGSLMRPVLGAFDPETAHGMTIAALKCLPPLSASKDDARLAVSAFGLNFPNPVGMAAGFDKNGEVPDPLLRLGFGFAEVGTVTPLPQPGNPRPRSFRLVPDEAVINRFGFNSQGHRAVLARLKARAGRGGIVGVNLGANKDAADRTADYVAGMEVFKDVASYFTINVSSPNTPGLRDLQKDMALDDLLARVLEARDRATQRAGRKPVLLKIAPDLTLPELDGVIAIAKARSVDGMIVSNTTLSRPESLKDQAQAEQSGGLSGRPLFSLSTKMLAASYLRVEGQFPLVGVGGIDSASTALEKIGAGASLVQLYTALVFKGVGLVDDIKQELVRVVSDRGLTSISSLTGCHANQYHAG